MSLPIATMPLASSADEAERHTHSLRVHGLMYGDWKDELKKCVKSAVGESRAEAINIVDISANPVLSLSNVLARSYDSAPAVMHPEALGEALLRLVSRGRHWLRASRLQRDVLGMREKLVRIDIINGRPSYRQVFAHHVEVEVDPDDPQRIVRLWERRERNVDGKAVWTWDAFFLEPGKDHDKGETIEGPSFRVLSSNRKEDITAKVLGDKYQGPYGGSDYKWRVDGVAELPYVVYRAADAGTVFDHRANLEIVEGTFTLGVYYSFFGHILRNASWVQRYIINGRPQGAKATGRGETHVAGDPGLIQAWESIADSQPIAGQWANPTDLVAFIEAVSKWERRLSTYMGINPSDLIRASGDPRSGYAVSVSREGQREQMKRVQPVFKESDLELIRKTAGFMNVANGTPIYPTDGYSLEYQGVPLSMAERKMLREEVFADMANGLSDPVDAYMRLWPGTNEDKAKKALLLHRENNRLFGDTRGAI